MIVAKLSERIKVQGFSHFGFASLKQPMHLALYREWLSDGCHGDMKWLADHLPVKENPQLLMSRARSAIVVTEPYYPQTPNHSVPNGIQDSAFGIQNSESRIQKTVLRTALYAGSRDYHLSLMEKLRALQASLEADFPGEQFLCYTDAQPVPERELAARAGLGWIGKNGCLIDRKHGSLFFIGGLLTSLDLEDSGTVPDHCGTCDRCIKACPTQAIRPNRTLDSRQCISYWTIEAKQEAPAHLRAGIGDWFFGCDICQTVCPWNEKVFGRNEMRALTQGSREQSLVDELRWVLSAGNREIESRFHESPILRSRARGLRRNALYIAGNLRLRELDSEIRSVAEKYPPLATLANWTLEQFALS